MTIRAKTASTKEARAFAAGVKLANQYKERGLTLTPLGFVDVGQFDALFTVSANARRTADGEQIAEDAVYIVSYDEAVKL